MAAATTSRPDCHLNAHYDMERSDMVVLTLLDIVTCPINLNHIDFMVIFNNQCDDSDDFDCYKNQI